MRNGFVWTKKRLCLSGRHTASFNPHPVVKKLHLNLVLWGPRGPWQLFWVKRFFKSLFFNVGWRSQSLWGPCGPLRTGWGLINRYSDRGYMFSTVPFDWCDRPFKIPLAKELSPRQRIVACERSSVLQQSPCWAINATWTTSLWRPAKANPNVWSIFKMWASNLLL